MSVFSDALSQLIDSKKIKVYDMIRYLEIDRSTMYQIIKGKRNPPADSQIEKMADFMLLTPSEREDLLEQAKITRLGKNIYYQRKGVAEFMCGFPDPPENDLQEPAKFSRNQDWQPLGVTEDVPEEEPILYLPTEFDVHRAIRGMLRKEAKKENGCIYLQLQPGENYLFDMLRSIIPEGNLKVEQILCLSNNDEMADEHSLLNIQYLNTIIPMYVRSKADFTAYYYYDNVESHFFHNNILPGMILTEKAALLIPVDYSYGLLIRDPKTVEAMKNLFEDSLNNCRELFDVIKVNMMDFSQVQNVNDTVTNKVSFHLMEREVCLFPFLTKDIIDKYLHPDIPGRDMMAEGLAAMLQSNRAMLESENMHIYFTQEGLNYFADTGKFKELPDEIYIPLAPDDRVMIMKELKEYCIRGTYRMLSGSLQRLAKNLRLCINGNMGYLLFNEKDSRVIYMFFTEPSLLFMFTDFIENVEEKDFASNDEAVAVIEKVCRQMERDEQSPS